jgi:preprotein translocase subunit YajC
VTSAGIFGVVSEVEGEVMWLEVAKGLELKVLKGTVDRLFDGDVPDVPDEPESPIGN